MVKTHLIPSAMTTKLEDLITDMNKEWIGLDKFFDRFTTHPSNVANYPIHNLIKESENNYTIEVAVAGFGKDDLSITFENQIITIRGRKIKEEKNYLYRGIASRDFEKTFPVTDHIEIKGAELVDGILRISLERVVPEELKSKSIEIK